MYNASGTVFSIGNKGASNIFTDVDASLDIFQYYVSDGTERSEFQDSVLIFIQNEAPFESRISTQ